MADLLSRPLLRRPEPAAGVRLPWLAAAGAAGWSALAGLALLGLPALLVWLAEGAATPVADPLRVAGQVWLAAHRVGVDFGGAWWQLAPWGLTVVLLLLLFRAGRWAAHGAGVDRLSSALRVAGAVAFVYATVAASVAGLVDVLGAPGTIPAEAAALGGLVALGGAGTGVVAEAGLVPAVLARVPRAARPSLAGGAVAAAALVGAGGLLVAFAAVAGASRITEVADAVDAGVLGGVLLALLGGALVPNAAVWAASYALGPGFAVGAGTAVAPSGVQVGMVPALPALGALPTSSGGAAGWLVLAVPIGAGVLAGLVVSRGRPHRSWWRPVLHAWGAAAVAAVTMALLAGLSGGSLGTDRLVRVGPDQALVALATLGEVGVVATLTVLALGLHARRAG